MIDAVFLDAILQLVALTTDERLADKLNTTWSTRVEVTGALHPGEAAVVQG